MKNRNDIIFVIMYEQEFVNHFIALEGAVLDRVDFSKTIIYFDYSIKDTPAFASIGYDEFRQWKINLV